MAGHSYLTGYIAVDKRAWLVRLHGKLYHSAHYHPAAALAIGANLGVLLLKVVEEAMDPRALAGGAKRNLRMLVSAACLNIIAVCIYHFVTCFV
jgi:dolichyl-phosphate-mannose--protein O-mannosyl transferase